MENRKQKEENEMEIDLVSLFFYLIDKWNCDGSIGWHKRGYRRIQQCRG